jgi:hypothetical protein
VPDGGGAPLAAGSTLTVFGTPAISDDRQLAAKVTIASGLARLAGIYFEDGAGASRLVARQGGASGVGTYTFKSFRDPLLSPKGKVAFWANLTGAPLTSDEGIWTDAFGDLQPVLREGTPIPGLGAMKLQSVTSMELRDDAGADHLAHDRQPARPHLSAARRVICAGHQRLSTLGEVARPGPLGEQQQRTRKIHPAR